MMRLTSLCAVLAIAAQLTACGNTVVATQVIVIIDAEPGVRAQTEKLHIVVQGMAGKNESATREPYDRSVTKKSGDLKWPYLVALEPFGGDAARPYEVVVTALDKSGEFIVQVRAISGYVNHKRLALRLLLEDSCIGNQKCSSDQTCRDGACENARIRAADLRNFTGNSDTAGSIGGGGRDSDRGDAGPGGQDRDSGASTTDGGSGGAGGGGTGGGGTTDSGSVGTGGGGTGGGGMGGGGTGGAGATGGSISSNPCDDDSDSDTFGDCIDDCDNDPAKQDPGQCGCGVADTDTDGDGVADCLDDCDDDPTKLVPGSCGCGVADIDSDGDLLDNCADECPFDASATAPPCTSTWSASNFDAALYTYVRTVDLGTCATTSFTYDSTTNVFTPAGWCGLAPEISDGVAQTSAGGPTVDILRMAALNLPTGKTIRLVGSQPVIVAVAGNAIVAGIIDASAMGTTPGAGGNWSCGTSAGGAAGGGNCTSGSTGGGGGGFGTAGGNGGGGGAGTIGGGGVARGSSSLTPLIGGCLGGLGGGNVVDAAGGAGGGAVQISAIGTLTVTGTIRTDGGVGAVGSCGNEAGGGGGGSGGAILLEGTTVATIGATFTANGGAGGVSGSADAGGAGSTSAGSAGAIGKDGGANGGGGGGGGYGRMRARVTGPGPDFASWTATNFTPQSYAYVENVVIDCNATFDSTGASPSFTTWCSGTQPVPVMIAQPGGPDVVVVPMKSLDVRVGRTLRVVGDKPVIFAVDGESFVDGTIDASAYGTTAGAGGNWSCAPATASGAGANGSHDATGDDGSGGGGGGGGAATGGSGGTGHSADIGVGGGGGAPVSPAALAPLRGGCPGGNGGVASTGGTGGAGGGAVQISARATLLVSGTIDVSGGGGRLGDAAEDGGGGGGSAGGILLEADSYINLGVLRATGGGGAGGNRTNAVTAANGTDGRAGGAGGGGGGTGGGSGGAGRAFGMVGANGANGTSYTYTDANSVMITENGAGAGGGGGSGGRVVVSAN